MTTPPWTPRRATTTSGTGGSGGTGEPPTPTPPTPTPRRPPTPPSSTGNSEVPTDDGGCGCRSNPNGERGALLALLTLLALTRRRRAA